MAKTTPTTKVKIALRPDGRPYIQQLTVESAQMLDLLRGDFSVTTPDLAYDLDDNGKLRVGVRISGQLVTHSPFTGAKIDVAMKVADRKSVEALIAEAEAVEIEEEEEIEEVEVEEEEVEVDDTETEEEEVEEEVEEEEVEEEEVSGDEADDEEKAEVDEEDEYEEYEYEEVDESEVE